MSQPQVTLDELFADAMRRQRTVRRVTTVYSTAEPGKITVEDTRFYLSPAPTSAASPPPPGRPYPAPPGVHPSTFPAPHREHTREGGRWIDIPWTLDGVRKVLAQGGFFLRGLHQFDSRRAAELAYTGKEAVERYSPDELLDQLMQEVCK